MFNLIALWCARYRFLQPFVRKVLPSTANFKVINEVRIEIPLQDVTGPGYYLNRGGPQAFYHYEETEKLEVIRALPLSGVFLDLGANIGLFSIYVAKMMPRVRCFAFEPSPELAQCIRKTALKSPFPQITVIESCLSDQEGRVDLFLHSRSSGGNSIIPANISSVETSRSIQVRAERLDSWVKRNALDRLDVIKMDVQGAEDLVLLGAQEVLSKFKPTLLIEIDHRGLITQEAKWLGLFRLPAFAGYSARIAGDEHQYQLMELPQVAKRQAGLDGYLNWVFEHRGSEIRTD